MLCMFICFFHLTLFGCQQTWFVLQPCTLSLSQNAVVLPGAAIQRSCSLLLETCCRFLFNIVFQLTKDTSEWFGTKHCGVPVEAWALQRSKLQALTAEVSRFIQKLYLFSNLLLIIHIMNLLWPHGQRSHSVSHHCIIIYEARASLRLFQTCLHCIYAWLYEHSDPLPVWCIINWSCYKH